MWTVIMKKKRYEKNSLMGSRCLPAMVVLLETESNKQANTAI